MNSSGGSCSSLMDVVTYDPHHHGHDEELHVLAVDDNLIDRKLVERLLKISSCKGSIILPSIFFIINHYFLHSLSLKCEFLQSQQQRMR